MREAPHGHRIRGRRQRQHGMRYRPLLFARRRDQVRLRSPARHRAQRAAQDFRRRNHGVLTVWKLSKRRFLQLAGVSIANKLVGQTVSPVQPARNPKTSKVILVTFGGGVRYSETFAPEGLHNIPRLVAMRPAGYFFSSCSNAGVLSHFNSTASIVTGNWQRVDDFGFQPPAGPTVFELFRKQTGAGPLDAWAVATN